MSVEEFFDGKSIFVTGGSGFVGKALIEKLLRSCDGIDRIYLLLRGKKGKTCQERLKFITENVLFKTIREKKPHCLEKLIPIEGDAAKIKLGLSEEDRNTLIENVDIIYHSAASVRFDDFLKDAVILNTRGTREVVELAQQMKHLVAFLHISTTYCNTDRDVIDEVVYPPHADWRKSIKLAEELDQHTFNVFAQKYISPLSNTYTFAKSLGEHVVQDLSKGTLPAAIVRPSVVIASVEEPLFGWADNLNGPIGLLCAAGKGVLRIVYGDLNKAQNYIPVDVLSNMIILATYQRAKNSDLNEVLVYNACGAGDAVVTYRDIIDLGRRLTWDGPIEKLFWYPSFGMTKNWFIFYVKFMIYHLLPALFTDLLLKIFGKTPMLFKIQRKIYIANMALNYFLLNEWQFINKKTAALTYNLMECDQRKFSFCYYFNVTQQEQYAFFLKGKISIIEIILKEKFNRTAGFRNTLILWLLDNLIHLVVYATFVWILVVKLHIFSIIMNKLDDMVSYWNNL